MTIYSRTVPLPEWFESMSYVERQRFVAEALRHRELDWDFRRDDGVVLKVSRASDQPTDGI